jgi:hypothetical protein
VAVGSSGFGSVQPRAGILVLIAHTPVFEAQLVDREAYRAMLSFGGTVAGLAGKGVSGLAAANRIP